uniref:Pyruvate kinase n=1 Tax=Macrostomum lignano TaxID=282301 RepID=A0A1I8I5E5_9PLAT
MASNSSNTHACSFRTALQQACSLDVDTSPAKTTGTGIMCTIGPASWSAKVIAEMVQAGMDIARLNLCHGTLEEHRRALKLIAEAEEKLRDDPEVSTWQHKPLGVAVDTRGSEIRTGALPEHGKLTDTVNLETDSLVTIDCSPTGAAQPITSTRLWVDFDNFAKIVQPGQAVYIDDGLLELRVESPRPADSAVDCLVIVGGQLGAARCVCLPGVDTGMPEVSQRDLDDLAALASDSGDDSLARIGIVMGSFVRSAETVRRLRQAATADGRPPPLVVAKIGDARGLQALEEILVEADGVLVARGDLGCELPQEKACKLSVPWGPALMAANLVLIELTIPFQVFAVQKRITAVCSTSAKASICATHLLNSMLMRPRPTRAEASDVANAVLDGVDCLMLSGETAIGKYPVEAVRTLTKICREAEASLQPGQHLQRLRRQPLAPAAAGPLHSSAMAACEAAVRCRAAAILVATDDAELPRLTAMFRPPCPVLCVCRDEALCRGLNMWYGLHPVLYTEPAKSEWLLEAQDRIRYAGLRVAANDILDAGPANSQLFVILVEKSCPNSSDLMAIVPVERLLNFGANGALPTQSAGKIL